MASSILTYNLFHAQAWSCTNVHDLILYYLKAAYMIVFYMAAVVYVTALNVAAVSALF